MADEDIERRKAEHLRIAARPESGFRGKTTLLDEVELVHCALPELACAQLDLSVELCGKRLRAPLYISGMTGGTQEARAINRALAKVAQQRGLAFGLGSQRAMLRDRALLATYEVRDVAPDMLLFANLGAVQAASTSTAEVRALCDDVGADALCIHVNPAQELTQAEGDRDFTGCLGAIRRLCAELGRPVIVKEVGAGLSRTVGAALVAAGASVLDVAGAGGTSWVGIEATRGGSEEQALGAELWDWGIPTAAALLANVDLGPPVLASGGIRTGMDVARALALGARAVGVAGEALRALLQAGEDGAARYLERIERTVQAVTLLAGCRTPAELARAPRVLGPQLQAWVAALRG